MPIIKLSTLLHGLVEVPFAMDREIAGLRLDSRAITAKDLFFAYQGNQIDSRQFINEAIGRGASAILKEVAGRAQVYLEENTPVIALPGFPEIISEIAQRFYSHPADRLKVIGVTGTNGKTSCTHFIADSLHQLQIACGLIGTLGNGLFGQIESSSLTTPDAITLQGLFADFVQREVGVVAMEVSSHSIAQRRVQDVAFELGIFTNLSRDHLDYHGDMDTYGSVKKKLFTDFKMKHAVINADDAFGQSMLKSLPAKERIIAYSTRTHISADAKIPLVYAKNIQTQVTGLTAHVVTPWGEGELQTQLMGEFNLSNLLAVLSALCLMRIPLSDVLQCIARLQPVPGRMQSFGGGGQPLIVVDYAHTPDALEKTLHALKQHCKGKLYCLFGCGGGRDAGKRALMAKAAETYADFIVITNDNPRGEDPEQIMQDILKGFADPEKVVVEYDRSKAIHDIIRHASIGDCVIIAGKGAETYQQIGSTKIPFSDIDKVKKFLSAQQEIIR